jgi:hypothetical protein
LNTMMVASVESSRAIDEPLWLGTAACDGTPNGHYGQGPGGIGDFLANLDLDLRLIREMVAQSASAASFDWFVRPPFGDSVPVESQQTVPGVARVRNQAAIRLLTGWLADESGYDERTWPVVKQALQENRPSYRALFDG